MQYHTEVITNYHAKSTPNTNGQIYGLIWYLATFANYDKERQRLLSRYN